MKEIQVGDTVLISPPPLSEQSYHHLAIIEEIANPIVVKCILYIDTKAQSTMLDNKHLKIDLCDITENYKDITIDEFVDMNPHFFI